MENDKKNQEETRSKKVERNSLEWLEIVLDKSVYFARNFGTSIGEKISKELQKIVGTAMQTVIMSSLFVVGVVFVMIGFVVLVNELIGFSNSIGYFMTGFIILFVVLLVKVTKHK